MKINAYILGKSNQLSTKQVSLAGISGLLLWGKLVLLYIALPNVMYFSILFESFQSNSGIVPVNTL